jgi:DNA transposition AAA+ family ATPase
MLPTPSTQPETDSQRSTGSYGIASHNFETTLATYPESAHEILRYWFFLGKDRDWSLAKLQEATGVSTTTLSRVFRGVYGAEIESVIATLERARLTYAESVDNPDFIETSLARRLFATFDKTRALGNVSIVWGKMGIGKTAVATEYQRLNNHGKTLLVRFPAGATFAFFVAHVAKACGVATRSQSQLQQRQKIYQVLSAGKRLLIVDELHQAFLTTRSDTAVKCCEFLREIIDVSNCGLVLMGTKLLQESVFSGPHKDALAQLVDRGTVQIPLPDKATKSDVKAFLANYGLQFPHPEDPAAPILNDILVSHGLRKLTMHLRDGAAFARKRQEPYDWSHFLAAFQAIQSLSK